MTPARCFALAVAFSACCFGAASAKAQGPGPAGLEAYPGPMVVEGPTMGYGDPGLSPYRSPPPLYSESGSGWDVEVPDDGTLVGHPSLFSGSGFLRVEYMYYDTSNPGRTYMGAPLAGLTDPASPFVIFAPGTNIPNGFARIPSTDLFDLRGTNGVRTTLGLELAEGGTVELSAFMLQQKKSGFIDNELGTTFVDFGGNVLELPNVYGTSVTINGEIGSTVYIYNQGFSTFYQSQLWGGELNYLPDTDLEGLIHFRPLIGARFLHLRERLSQYGRYQELAPVASFEAYIDSKTNNYMGGGQIGARLELVTKLIDFGAEAKAMALSNTMYAEVASANLRFPGDPMSSFDDNTTQLAFGLDLTGWATLHVLPSMDVRVGYNFLYLANITRPEDNIIYNERGIANPADISLEIERQDMFFNGVTLGAEFRW